MTSGAILGQEFQERQDRVPMIQHNPAAGGEGYVEFELLEVGLCCPGPESIVDSAVCGRHQGTVVTWNHNKALG